MNALYQSADWRTWPEVQVTPNPGLPAYPCCYCMVLGQVTTVRVHQPAFFDDVCELCAPAVVQYAIDRHDDRHITQVEVAS